MKRRSSQAFSLLELLVVIAVIALLAALLAPSLGAARRAGAKARTKVRFAQWTVAIEAFRSEYGNYPVFDESRMVNGGISASTHLFHELLSARKRSGAALVSEDLALKQNRKRIAFYRFAADELDPSGRVVDASGNPEIAVLTDRDLDGVIKDGVDFITLPAVNGLTPSAADFPAVGIRAGVVFYSSAPNGTVANPAFVFSWK